DDVGKTFSMGLPSTSEPDKALRLAAALEDDETLRRLSPEECRRSGRMKLAVSSYSFHRFGRGPEPDAKPDFSALVDRCADWGLDGLEVLGLHFASTEPGELHALRQHAFRRGIPIIAVSAHHNFVTPDPAKRQEEIEKLCRWVDVADEVGAPAVRAFGGRWA